MLGFQQYYFFQLISGNIYEDVLNDAELAQSLMDNSFDDLWNTYILSNHPIWEIIVTLASLIATVTVFIRLGNVAKKSIDNERVDWEGCFYSLIITIALHNSAAFTGIVSYSLFAVQDTVVEQSINDLKATASVANTFEKILGQNNAKNFYRLAHAQCEENYLKNMDAYATCMEEELAKAETAVSGLTDTKPWHAKAIDSVRNFASNIRDNATKNLKYVLQSASVAEKRLNLFMVGVSFNVMGNFTLFIFGLFSPLIIAASALPNGEDGVIKYLTGFYFVGAAKLTFTLIVVLMGDMFDGADNIQEFMLAHGIGIFAPVIALGVAGGSSIMVFNALNGAGMKIAGNLSPTSMIRSFNRK